MQARAGSLNASHAEQPDTANPDHTGSRPILARVLVMEIILRGYVLTVTPH
jgi:hypothetical protein